MYKHAAQCWVKQILQQGKERKIFHQCTTTWTRTVDADIHTRHKADGAVRIVTSACRKASGIYDISTLKPKSPGSLDPVRAPGL